MGQESLTFDPHYTVTMGTPVWRTRACNARSFRFGLVGPILTIYFTNVAFKSLGVSNGFTQLEGG